MMEKENKKKTNKDFEDSMQLFCDECQIDHKMFDKFNQYMGLYFCCCCYYLKDPINHRVEYEKHSRLKCCAVCRDVSIYNSQTYRIVKESICNFCLCNVSIRFMKQEFSSLSKAHDHFMLKVLGDQFEKIEF